MAPPLALIFGEVLLGGILLKHGLSDVKAALPGGADGNTAAGTAAAESGLPGGVATGSGGVTGPPADTSGNAKAIYDYFHSHGLSDNAIAGLMANFNFESGYDPTSQNPGQHVSYPVGADLPYTHAYGLAQWLGGREVGSGSLSEFAAARGKSPSDLETQLEFAWSELSGPYAGVLAQLQAAGSPADAASIDYWQYEGGGWQNEGSLPGREQLATQLGSQGF